MTKPIARLRVSFMGDGSPMLTAVIFLNGVEVEAIVDGVAAFHLLGVPGASHLDVRLMTQCVEFVSNGRAEEASTEEGPLQGCPAAGRAN